MRVYSAANVIQEFLEKPPVGLFEKFISKMSKNMPANLEIKLPHRLFLKGELIAETISEEIEESFSQSDLVGLLTKEILNYYSLNNNPIKLYRTFKEISSSFIVTRYTQMSKEEQIPVKITLSKKDIFKLEMILADIEEIEGEINFTVEDLLELQYMNFMSDLLQGNNEDAIKRIIHKFNNS